MSGVDIIKQFVEGRLAPRAFEQCLHTDAALQTLLEGERDLPAYVAEPDLYLYLISQDYQSLACIYNVQTLLSERLDSQGIAHAWTTPTSAASRWPSMPSRNGCHCPRRTSPASWPITMGWIRRPCRRR